MMDAALEATVTPEAHLLAKFYEAPGARKVERFIKNAAFSLETAPSPSPATNKRRKMNSTLVDNGGGQVQPQMRNAGYSRGQHVQPHNQNGRSGQSRRPGRGGYNKNFRSPQLDQRQQTTHADHRRGTNLFDKRSHSQDQRRDRDSDPRRGSTPVPSPLRQQRGMPVEMIEQTPPPGSTSTSSNTFKPWSSPIKGKVLDWGEL